MFTTLKKTIPEIGVVTYRLDETSGHLHARWYHSDLDSGQIGTGTAIPCEAIGFEGSFAITYNLSTGVPVGTFKLTITRVSDTFSLEWLDGEILTYVGIGILDRGNLLAGWRRVIAD